MKKTFLTNMLPMIAAAVLLATSCSKDSDNNVVTTPDNTVPVQEQVVDDNQVKTIPFSITVGRDANTLSKATVDEGSLSQKFEAGDQLVISGTDISGTLSLKSGANEATATFEGELSGSGVSSITDATPLTATLTNTTNSNTGAELTEVKSAESLAEAFQKYGYWTASFTYGTRNNVELVQNTAFVRVNLPFHGTKLNVKIGETTTPVYLNGDEILAVPNGATISCTLLGINKTVDISEGKVVLNIKNRTTPDDCIAGVFSVGDDKQIFFSKGNLKSSTSSSYIIQSNQWDYDVDGHEDLFNLAEYNALSVASPWSILSQEEWQYLLGMNGSKRTNADGLCKWGAISTTNGLIILPDGCKVGIDSDWSTLEAAGAVFLPAAGHYLSERYGANKYAGMMVVVDGKQYRLHIDDKGKSFSEDGNQRSVRLVRGL